MDFDPIVVPASYTGLIKKKLPISMDNRSAWQFFCFVELRDWTNADFGPFKIEEKIISGGNIANSHVKSKILNLKSKIITSLLHHSNRKLRRVS